MEDMPKLYAPFLKDKDSQRVIPEINPGFEWVFEDPDVLCTEKLDGTNVGILMHGGELKGICNRTTPIPFNALIRNRFINGVSKAYEKGRVSSLDGQYFGELMGPKIQKNFLDLTEVEWFPFEYLRKKFSYRSFHEYPKTFDNISKWFKDDLFSLGYSRLHKGQKKAPEGVVFYQPSTGNMAKLRRDMFDWYDGKGHKE